MSRKKLLFYFSLLLLLIVGALITRHYYKKIKGKLTLIEATDKSVASLADDYYTQRDGIIYYDFETLNGTENLYEEMSHSGKYSCKVFGNNSFSPIITKRVSEIGKNRLDRAGISAYIYVFPKDAATLKASLVFSITDNKDNNIVWKSVEIVSAYFKPGQWQKVSGAFDIDTASIPEGCVIKAYLWNDSKAQILIDDIMVVTGRDQPFRGDTTWCDITGNEVWQQNTGHPPYPFVYLNTLTPNNKTSSSLSGNNKLSDEILIDSRSVCAGNFYNPANNRDKVLALHEDSLYAYSYCDNNNTFTCDFQTVLKPEDSIWLTSRFLPARYCGKATDEILLQDTASKTLALYYIGNTTAGTCSQKPSLLKTHCLWKGNYTFFSLNGKTPVSFWPVYLTPIKKTSLLCIYDDGHWQVFEFQKSDWASVAKSNKPNNTWNQSEYTYTLVGGCFTSFAKSPQLLSIATSRKNKQSEYHILSFDTRNNTFNTVYPKTTSDNNKTTNADAFSTYFTLNVTGATVNTLLKYDDSWRFDLKLLSFLENTLTVKYNLDFKGYDNHYNPKYYENTVFLTGAFTNAGITSLLTWCYNNPENKNQSLLPDALYLFSFQNPKN
ncbi:MAG: hypothetical protein BWY70_00766 [Bacteroidetes bacterium ADurb.Bin408]|nr:MAG: hypothetical protein BWY70_00766 [Bacteroidetes bacterium ADurb.Bin408]